MPRTERLTDPHDRVTLAAWLIALSLLLAAAIVWPQIAAVVAR